MQGPRQTCQMGMVQLHYILLLMKAINMWLNFSWMEELSQIWQTTLGKHHYTMLHIKVT